MTHWVLHSELNSGPVRAAVPYGVHWKHAFVFPVTVE